MTQVKGGDWPGYPSRTSIKRKVLFLVTGVSTAAMLLVCAVLLGHIWWTIRDRMVGEFHTIASIMGDNCASALLFNAEDDAEATLNTLALEPSVICARVYHADGSEFAEYLRTGEDSPVLNHAITNSGYDFSPVGLEVWKEIIHDGRVIGSVFIVTDLRYLHHEIFQTAISAVVLIILAVLFTYLLASSLQGKISGPIMELANTARRISELQDYSLRAERKSDDEVGELNDAFNLMLDTIETANTTLKERETRFRSLFHNAPEGVFIMDGSCVAECNPGAEALLGVPKELIIGKTVLDFSPELQLNGISSLKLAEEYILKATKGEPQFFEWVNLDGDGIPIDTEVSLSSIELNGKAYLQAIVRDISKRKRAEANLKRFARVIDQASEVVVITDTEGNITYVNPAFERVSGYTSKEAIGQNPRILQSGLTPKVTYIELWETLLKGETWTGRFINRHKDGFSYTEEATISPLRSPTGETINFVAVKRDVTRELELEEQFYQAQKMDAVGKLAGGVAHDFNNLLQVIRGFGELLRDELAARGERSDGLFQILKAAESATTLVRQLLAFSRKQVLELEVVNLGTVVGDMSKMIKRVIGEDIEFNFNAAEDLPLIQGDKGQLEQVLMNLCVNARDAMTRGGTLTLDIKKVEFSESFSRSNAWARPGSFVLLSVTDTGCGMDSEIQKRIFEPFFTTKELGKGTGLGLSTVFGIVQQHDGIVNVFSQPGAGATFRIYFPCIKRGESREDQSIIEQPAGGTETILIADDDAGVCNVAKSMLGRAGYTVITVQDGEEAICAFEEYADKIDLAILDVVMPKLSGKAVYEYIHARNPDIPVFFASGYGTEGVQKDYLLEEGMPCIRKPFDRNDLLKRVRRLLDDRSLNTAIESFNVSDFRTHN